MADLGMQLFISTSLDELFGFRTLLSARQVSLSCLILIHKVMGGVIQLQRGSTIASKTTHLQQTNSHLK